MTERNDFIPLSKTFLKESTRKAAYNVLESGWLGYGKNCKLLENSFGNATSWAVATNSCSSALWVIANIIPHTSDSEVIMPSINFTSAFSAFKQNGWKIIFADVDPKTGLICPDDVKAKINSKTKIIVAVDLYGQCCPLEELRSACEINELYLVLDSAHAVRKIDSRLKYCDFICFSFGPTKEIGAPDGGLLLSSIRNYEKDAREICNLGMDTSTLERIKSPKHLPVEVSQKGGLKLLMSDLTATIVLHERKHLSSYKNIRKQIFEKYNAAFEDTDFVLPEIYYGHSFQYYRIGVSNSKRPLLRRELSNNNISTSDHYPIRKNEEWIREGDLKGAIEFSSKTVILPVFIELNSAQIDFITNKSLSILSLGHLY